MYFNWFTMLAQLINFTVLMVILNYVLYRPIVRAMRERSEGIKNTIDNANKKLQEAEKERQLYSERLSGFDEEKIQKMEKLEKDLEAEKIRLMDLAKEDLGREDARWRERLENKHREMLVELESAVGENFSMFSSRVFRDLASAEVEREAINTFFKKFDILISPDKIEEINKIPPESDDGKGGLIIKVSTSFNLDDGSRKDFSDRAKAKGIKFKNVEFTVDEGLVLGVRMWIHSYLLEWSVRGMMEDFVGNLEAGLLSENRAGRDDKK